MTMHDEKIPDALVAFIATLTQVHTVEAVFQHLGDYCTELLPADGVGVLLLEEQDVTVATANSAVGDIVEALEVELQEGPCVECVRAGHPVLVPDLAAAADRYPRFAPLALEAGAGAIHALPMTGHSELVGSLDIINLQPTELTEDQLRTARMLSDVAVSYIIAVRLHEETSALADQLQSALDTRVVIEQAKGMLAERHGEPLRDAFNRLRTHARSQSTPVREIARQVVEERLQP
mgnify:FL=1